MALLGDTTATIATLAWPTTTASNYSSSGNYTVHRPKIVERPAPWGKSARRRKIEERWEPKGR